MAVRELRYEQTNASDPDAIPSYNIFDETGSAATPTPLEDVVRLAYNQHGRGTFEESTGTFYPGPSYADFSEQYARSMMNKLGIPASATTDQFNEWLNADRYQQYFPAITEGDGGLFGELGGILGTFGSVIPGPWQPFAMAFNAVNQLDQGNVLGALMSGAGAAGFNVGGEIGSALGIPSNIAPLVGNAAIGMLSGQGIEDILLQAAIGQGMSMASEAVAPVINDALQPASPAVGQGAYDVAENFAAPVDMPVDDPMKRRRVLLADASGDLSGILNDPSYLQTPRLITPEGGNTMLPNAQNLYAQIDAALSEPATTTDPVLADPSLLQAPLLMTPTTSVGMLPSGPSMPAAVPEEGDPTNPPPAAESKVTAEQIEKYAKAAKKLYDLLGGQDKATAGAPRRPMPRRNENGEEIPPTPEEEKKYFEDVVNYLGLDLVVMDEAGLIPGTPEYLEYILQQADSVINQVLGDADPDAEAFSDQLRSKSEQELVKLMRALYVRGQLGALSGSGSYLDPFTGTKEDVAVPEGKRVRPGVAAYQRGLARSVDDLAKMKPQEAKRFLGGLLEREPDLYHMQAGRDAQALREALESRGMDDLKRRRRGMFGDEAYFQQELEGMGGVNLEQLLAMLMGRDTGRQGAAIEELFGWTPEDI